MKIRWTVRLLEFVVVMREAMANISVTADIPFFFGGGFFFKEQRLE